MILAVRTASIGSRPLLKEVCRSAMVLRELLRTRCRTLAVAALVLAIVGGYVLVWVHAEHVHESAASADKCVVCSWAKSLATIGAAEPAIAMVCPAGRIALPSLPARHPFSYRLPFSARSPPRMV